jgi:hypothetical protein
LSSTKTKKTCEQATMSQSWVHLFNELSSWCCFQKIQFVAFCNVHTTIDIQQMLIIVILHPYDICSYQLQVNVVAQIQSTAHKKKHFILKQFLYMISIMLNLKQVLFHHAPFFCIHSSNIPFHPVQYCWSLVAIFVPFFTLPRLIVLIIFHLPVFRLIDHLMVQEEHGGQLFCRSKQKVNFCPITINTSSTQQLQQQHLITNWNWNWKNKGQDQDQEEGRKEDKKKTRKTKDEKEKWNKLRKQNNMWIIDDDDDDCCDVL